MMSGGYICGDNDVTHCRVELTQSSAFLSVVPHLRRLDKQREVTLVGRQDVGEAILQMFRC